MKSWWVITKLVVALLGSMAVIGWAMWHWLKRSDDPARLIFKWTITAGVLVVCGVTTARIGWSPALPGVAAVFGILLTFIWGTSFGEMLARPFTSLFDGSGTEAKPTPLYSIAEANRKKGKYAEAIAEVQKQLERFPTDFQGWMMLAEIQAEDQQNVTGAINSIKQLVGQRGHAPKNIAFALSRCADWELKFRQDREAARRLLERIVELLPDTEQAQMAMQRIAHLAPPELLIEQHDPHRIR